MDNKVTTANLKVDVTQIFVHENLSDMLNLTIKLFKIPLGFYLQSFK